MNQLSKCRANLASYIDSRVNSLDFKPDLQDLVQKILEISAEVAVTAKQVGDLLESLRRLGISGLSEQKSRAFLRLISTMEALLVKYTLFEHATLSKGMSYFAYSDAQQQVEPNRIDQLNDFVNQLNAPVESSLPTAEPLNEPSSDIAFSSTAATLQLSSRHIPEFLHSQQAVTSSSSLFSPSSKRNRGLSWSEQVLPKSVEPEVISRSIR